MLVAWGGGQKRSRNRSEYKVLVPAPLLKSFAFLILLVLTSSFEPFYGFSFSSLSFQEVTFNGSLPVLLGLEPTNWAGGFTSLSPWPRPLRPPGPISSTHVARVSSWSAWVH